MENRYNGLNRHSIYLTMDDGVRIALNYFIPTIDGKEAEEPLPVIFEYTPYQCCKEEISEDGSSKVVYNDRSNWGIEEISRSGYIIAAADVRGTGASFGARVTTNSRREAQDGKAVIEWITSQPFCTGKLGTIGSSYTGQTQLECLSTAPKGLCASVIGMTDYDKYDGWIRDGIPRAFGSRPDTFYGDTPEEIEATVRKIAFETVPVEGDEDRALLLEAIGQHVDSGLQIPLMRDLNWRNSYLEASGGEHWNIISARTYRDIIESTGAAIYLMGGVWDVFRRETFVIYENLKLPKKLHIGPWYHVGHKTNPEWGPEMKRWFDYWLKGIDNGVMDEDPITLRVANYDFENHDIWGRNTGYYRSLKTWPDAETKTVTEFLQSGSTGKSGELVKNTPSGGFADLRDPYGPKFSVESGIVCSKEDPGLCGQGISFTGSPLKEDLYAVGYSAGYVSFSLEDPGWMPKDRLDTDIFLCLSDYCPDTGEAFQVTDGHLRASLRAESPCPYKNFGLPWHRCNMGDNEYLETGKRYDLKISFQPTSYVFKKGHCLRLTVSTSMDRMYYNGRLVYEADPDCKKPVIRLYTGGDNPSRIELSVEK